MKNEEIKDNFKAKGLLEAKKELDILKLSDFERRSYEYYKEDLHQQASMFESSYGDGWRKGREEGREEGKKEGIEEGLREGEAKGEKKAKFEIARRLLLSGSMSLEEIADISGLTIEEVKSL